MSIGMLYIVGSGMEFDSNGLGEDEPLFYCLPNSNNYIEVYEIWMSIVGPDSANKNKSAIIHLIEFSTNPTGGDVMQRERLERGDSAFVSAWFSRPTAGWTTGGVVDNVRRTCKPFNISHGFYWSAAQSGKPILINEAQTGWGVLFVGPDDMPDLTYRAGCMIRESPTD